MCPVARYFLGFTASSLKWLEDNPPSQKPLKGPNARPCSGNGDPGWPGRPRSSTAERGREACTQGLTRWRHPGAGIFTPAYHAPRPPNPVQYIVLVPTPARCERRAGLLAAVCGSETAGGAEAEVKLRSAPKLGPGLSGASLGRDAAWELGARASRRRRAAGFPQTARV